MVTGFIASEAHGSLGRVGSRAARFHSIFAAARALLLGLALLLGAPRLAGAIQEGDAPAQPSAPADPSASASTAPAGHARGHRFDAGESTLAPPTSLVDLSAWLDYKSRGHVTSLPIEARVFYRRGLMLRGSGASDEAMRLVRGAAELDPGYLAPHVTLASWLLVSEPGQSLQQYASALELVRQNFALQIAISANLLVLLLQALFLGLLAAGLIMVGVHQSKLRHMWRERITTWVLPTSATRWSWALLVLPFFAGFGLAMPTVVMLGMLWPHLRVRERTVFVLLTAGLVGVPWLAVGLDRMSGPFQAERAPFYAVPLIQNGPDALGQRDRIEHLAAQNPDNPFVQFASAWLARRDGDLRSAEAAYRRTLVLWPGNDRVLNDLGNTLAAQGRIDEALDIYQKAIASQPGNAAAHFNASQIHTLRFDYHDATDELSRASALNFDLVKTYQSQAGDDGWLPLADQWVAPPLCWHALSNMPLEPVSGSSLPPGWRASAECSGWGFSIFALLAAVLSVMLGLWLQQTLPLRACSNCGRTVCRRCAERRRELALCPTCAGIESRAESPEFARVLLLQHRRKGLRLGGAVRMVLGTLVPGYGLLAHRRVLMPALLLSGAAALIATETGAMAPFSAEPRLLMSGDSLPLSVTISLWTLIYLVSIAGFLASERREREQAARLAEPVRSRSTQATHVHRAAA